VSTDPEDSVFLVTSSDPDNQQFGTAFAFYSGEDANGHTEATYFYTCRHVVTDVGGPDKVRIGGYPAKVVVQGSEDGLDDLAALRVEDLRNVPFLRLNPSAEAGNSVKVLGFRSFARSLQIIRPLQAQLGERVGLETRRKPGRVLAWDLKIEGDYDLEQGYSGGPVIEEDSGDVIGIANYRLGGRKGVALSIGTLERFRPAMIEEIRASIASLFWHSLLSYVSSAEAADASILRTSDISSQDHFLGLARSPGDARFNLVLVMVEADNLGQEEIDEFLLKLYANAQRLGYTGGGRFEICFVFLNGCPQEILHFILEQAKTAPDSVGRIFFFVFDLKEGQIYTAPRSEDATLPPYTYFLEQFRSQYPLPL
jgi:hypothetical protein